MSKTPIHISFTFFDIRRRSQRNFKQYLSQQYFSSLQITLSIRKTILISLNKLKILIIISHLAYIRSHLNSKTPCISYHCSSYRPRQPKSPIDTIHLIGIIDHFNKLREIFSRLHSKQATVYGSDSFQLITNKNSIVILTTSKQHI